nr:MAG TPA: hypothetical protein [Caudoviricetes sp.]DAR51933.1 MAG TPA: hypothetical protein [Caudoviricetes sp.]DAZ82546.1 MAG TPA: hypothetical protein [Caudoviricetes sp.]
MTISTPYKYSKNTNISFLLFIILLYLHRN